MSTSRSLGAALPRRATPCSRCTIYEFSATSNTFFEFQSIATSYAYDLEAFAIGGRHFLAVAEQYSSSGNSRIYEFSAISNTFFEFQSIATPRATGWEAFAIGGRHFLAVANFGGSSKIYEFIAAHQRFNEFQSFVYEADAMDWEHVAIGSRHFLALANNRISGAGGIIKYNLNSTIYEFSTTTDSFIVFQSVPTVAAFDWEHFALDGRHFLAVANLLDSTIYEYSATSASFVEFQSVSTSTARDWDHFVIGEQKFSRRCKRPQRPQGLRVQCDIRLALSRSRRWG